jgi:hypothetical protein
MDMWMQRKILTPGVKYADHSGFSPEVLRILSEIPDHAPCCIEEQFVDLPRFIQTQFVECFGQSEYHMEISCWKQLRLSRLDPTLALYLLALRTMPITT